MSLYKNDVLVDMTKEMKQKVYTELGISTDKKKIEKGFEMKIKMPESMYSKSPGNEKPDRPAVSVIPLNSQIGGTEGSEKWNYATGRDKNERKGSYEYFANYSGVKSTILSFTDTHTISSKHIDLMYFLLFLSPCREIPGESETQREARGVKSNQKFMFVVENKEKESSVRITDTLKFAKVEMAILETLSLSDVRKIAGAMGISNATEKGELTLRDELLQSVRNAEKAGRKGYDRFIMASKLDEMTEVKYLIQRSIDLKLTKEDGNRSFTYINKEGKRMSEICGTYAGRTLRESVEYHLMNEPAELERLRVAVKEKEMVEESVEA